MSNPLMWRYCKSFHVILPGSHGFPKKRVDQFIPFTTLLLQLCFLLFPPPWVWEPWRPGQPWPGALRHSDLEECSCCAGAHKGCLLALTSPCCRKSLQSFVLRGVDLFQFHAKMLPIETSQKKKKKWNTVLLKTVILMPLGGTLPDFLKRCV